MFPSNFGNTRASKKPWRLIIHVKVQREKDTHVQGHSVMSLLSQIAQELVIDAQCLIIALRNLCLTHRFLLCLWQF